jgi:hypothetical protein
MLGYKRRYRYLPHVEVVQLPELELFIVELKR